MRITVIGGGSPLAKELESFGKVTLLDKTEFDACHSRMWSERDVDLLVTCLPVDFDTGRDGYGGSIWATRRLIDHLRIPVIIHTGMSSDFYHHLRECPALVVPRGNWTDQIVIDTVEQIAKVWGPMDADQRDAFMDESLRLFQQELEKTAPGVRLPQLRRFGLFPEVAEQRTIPMDAVFQMLQELGEAPPEQDP